MDHAVNPATPTSPEAAQETPKPRKRGTQHPDRVWIGPDALNRLSSWVADVSDRLQGVTVTRGDLANFIIMNHPEALSATEMKDIEARYFDPIKHAQWALAELDAALARGEKVTLIDIVLNSKPSNTTTPRSRKPRTETSKHSENADKNAQKQPHSIQKDSLISIDNSSEQ